MHVHGAGQGRSRAGHEAARIEFLPRVYFTVRLPNKYSYIQRARPSMCGGDCNCGLLVLWTTLLAFLRLKRQDLFVLSGYAPPCRCRCRCNSCNIASWSPGDPSLTCWHGHAGCQRTNHVEHERDRCPCFPSILPFTKWSVPVAKVECHYRVITRCERGPLAAVGRQEALLGTQRLHPSTMVPCVEEGLEALRQRIGPR